MKIRSRTCCLVMMALLAAAAAVRADVKSKAAQEAAEYVMQRFGRQVVKEGVAELATKIETYSARYGEEEVLLAVRRAGPETFALVDAAGADGSKAIRVLARYGEEGATQVLKKPGAMAQVIRYGDDAAAVLVKHPGIAEPLVEKGGASAVKALSAVTPQNGRRLAMLLEGDLGKVARSEELLDVIAKYGNRATEFVWENKAALATGTVMVAFLADPEPFLNGATKITAVVGETTAKPLAEGVARGTNWTVILLVITALATASVLFLAAKYGLFSGTVAAARAASSGATPTVNPDSARTNPGSNGMPSS
jgi:hypothetical protein